MNNVILSVSYTVTGVDNGNLGVERKGSINISNNGVVQLSILGIAKEVEKLTQTALKDYRELAKIPYPEKCSIKKTSND